MIPSSLRAGMVFFDNLDACRPNQKTGIQGQGSIGPTKSRLRIRRLFWRQADALLGRNLTPAGRAGADFRIVAAGLIAPVDVADNLRALGLVERCGILLVRVVARRVGRARELSQAEQNGASGHTRRNRIARAVAAVMMMVVAARRRCAPMLRCAVTGRVVGTVRGMGAGAAVPPWRRSGKGGTCQSKRRNSRNRKNRTGKS